MADSEHSQIIAEFCRVTGTDPSRARLYLEANGWDSDLAMSSYFEEVEEEESSSSAAVAFPRPGSPKPDFPSNPSTGHNRVTTFSNLKNNTEDNDEEGQAFYAGGSERSGQQVLGPGKRKAGNEVVEEMFKAVRKFGGEMVDTSQKPAATTLKAFKGTGFVLDSAGSDDKESTARGESSQDRPRNIEIRLRLWQTGFTVDDGPLRDYNDPASKGFLDSVRKGEVPAELLRRAGDSEIHLNIEDKSHEEYIPRRSIVQAFTGSGHRLGDIAPNVAASAGEPSEKAVSDAQGNIQIDESKPTTAVQIRLSDGSRLMMKANHTHNIGDVRQFIVISRPEYCATEFILMTAFPPKELTEDSATLEELNLLNSVIVQKLK